MAQKSQRLTEISFNSLFWEATNLQEFRRSFQPLTFHFPIKPPSNPPPTNQPTNQPTPPWPVPPNQPPQDLQGCDFAPSVFVDVAYVPASSLKPPLQSSAREDGDAPGRSSAHGKSWKQWVEDRKCILASGFQVDFCCEKLKNYMETRWHTETFLRFCSALKQCSIHVRLFQVCCVVWLNENKEKNRQCRPRQRLFWYLVQVNEYYCWWKKSCTT